MWLLLRTTFVIAGNLAFVGLFVGVISGMAALWLGEDLDSAALIVTRGYWGLALLFPVALWFAHLILPDFKEPGGFPGESARLYLTIPSGMLTSLLGALLGIFLGGVPFFLVLGANLPILFGGYDADTFFAALSARIFWGQITLVALVTLLSALPMVYWVHRIVKEWY
jgi:hypothetical protein